MKPQTLKSIEFALTERREGWEERIAQAMLESWLTAASPAELGPIVAIEFGGVEDPSEYYELEMAAEAVLSQSPVIADQAAVALVGSGGYPYPAQSELVVVERSNGQPAVTIYADGSALLSPAEPWSDWEDALVRLIEAAVEDEGQASLAISPAMDTAEARTCAAQARQLAERYGATVTLFGTSSPDKFYRQGKSALAHSRLTPAHAARHRRKHLPPLNQNAQDMD